MGVFLGDADGAMPCQYLDSAEGDAGLDELTAKGVAEGVDRSGQVGAAEGAAEGACQGKGGYLGEDERAGRRRASMASAAPLVMGMTRHLPDLVRAPGSETMRSSSWPMCSHLS